MKILSESEVDHVAGGIATEIDRMYQYAKEAAREFWRGFKEGAGIGDH